MTLDLDAIRERADAATQGPWEATANGRVLGPPRLESAYERDIAETALNGGDAEFIAHARSDIPALLTEITQLRNVGVGARSVEGIRAFADDLDQELGRALSQQQAVGLMAARDVLRWVLGEDPR